MIDESYSDFIVVSTTIITLAMMIVSYLQWRKLSSNRMLYNEISLKLNNAWHDIQKSQIKEERLTRQQKILNRIVACANKSLLENDEFTISMETLAKELRDLFESEYCSIGKVVNDIVEDYVVSYDNYEDQRLSAIQSKSMGLVRSVNVNNTNYKVCNALKSDRDVSYYGEESINVSENRHYQIYAEHILISKSVKNTTIVPIRDNNGTCGYLQLINSRKKMDIADIAPFREALLQLIQLIIRTKEREEELVQNKNLLKDTNFFRDIIGKKDDVNGLFDAVMEYLVAEFNAAVITFRIPILDGYERIPKFYLRRCFINNKVKNSKKLLNYCYTERLLKGLDEMGGKDYLKCINSDAIIVDEAKDTDYYKDYNLKIKQKTLIVPIIRDYSTNICRNPDRNSKFLCELGTYSDCVNRFEKLYGVFKLRIFDEEQEPNADSFVTAVYEERKLQEQKNRLQYLSKQITILLNSLADKYENESLMVFQEKLRSSTFTKIMDFDQTYVETIKDTVNAKACAIYRFDKLNKTLRRTAITGANFKKKTIILENENSIIVKVFKGKCSRYVYELENEEYLSLKNEPSLFVPIIKKDGSCAGVIIVIGKTNIKHSISTTYWEHDKTHIDFIVNILNRISESDTERLIFLQQLSHELLIPITNTVNDNDFTIDTAERNKNIFTKDMLLEQLKTNMERNMLFKYIVSDVENIFSTSNKTIQYNMAWCDNPKELLLDAIRMMERDAHATKGISIVTNISDMPPMILDKERIMQVFINLLKNAIRYSNRNSTVEVFYKFTEGQHEIKFVNYGIGIPKEDSDMIFELFSRSQNARDVDVRGSGMGLYIVKGIMKAHGGDCVIRKLDRPTEISIIFPSKHMQYE